MDSSGPDLPGGTVTFLFSDIEGSTRLVDTLPASTYRQVIEQHHRLLRRAFSENGGIERGTEGDSFLVVFTDAPSAVQAAISAQHELERAEWVGPTRVRVRMGLHTGLGVHGGDDYVGIDINRASRIASAAHGGQILVSETTRVLSERSLPEGVGLRDLGDHWLKGIEKSERLSQLVVDGLPDDFPPLRTMAVGVAHVPARLTSFIGRTAEIETVREMLIANRLVTLIGPGGTGKTSLAVELGRQAVTDYADGTWFVDLAPLTNPEQVGSAIARTLDLPTKSGRPVAELVAEHLAARELLLIVDNFEHLLPAADLISDQVMRSPRLRVLATSRTRLNLYGEQIFPVPPLGVPPPEAAADPELLAEQEAIALFVERANAADPSFSMSMHNATTVAQICRRLDGLPLAIELAASRCRVLTVEEIIQRLENSLPVLSGTEENRPSRHQTLEALIDWSYQLLDDVERDLFERFSFFVGGFTLTAAQEVCDPDGELGIDILDGVSSLESQSLVRRVSSEGATRFEMLETIRDFARDRLERNPGLEYIAARHLAFFRDLGEAAEPHLMDAEKEEWLGRLELEEANIHVALHTALETGDLDESGLRLAASVWRYWFEHGHLSEGREWVESLLALHTDSVSPARAKGYTALGGLTYWLSDAEATESAYATALAIYRQLGDDTAIADAMYNLTFGSSMRGDMEETHRRVYASFDAAREVGSPLLIARSQIGVALAKFMSGEAEESAPMIEEAVSVFRETGDPFQIGWGLGVLGQVYIQLGDIEKGTAAFIESLGFADELGNTPALVAALRSLGMLMSSVGRHLEATRLTGALDTLKAEVGSESPLPEFVNPDVDAAEKALGTDAFTVAREEGRRMTTQEAVEFAIRALRRLQSDSSPEAEYTSDAPID